MGKRDLKLKMMKEKKDIDENRNIIEERKSSSTKNPNGEKVFEIGNDQRKIKDIDENRIIIEKSKSLSMINSYMEE